MRVKSIVAFLLGLVILTGTFPLSLNADIADYSNAQITSASPVIKGHSISLGGTIELNYYLNIPSQYANSGTKARFSWGDGSSETGLVSVSKNGSNCLAKCSLPSVCMTDTVRMTLVDNNRRVLLTEDYRIVDYIDSLALQYRDTVKNHDKYLQRLLEAILIYGSKCQQYYSYRTDDLADSAGYMRNIMTNTGNQKMTEVVGDFRNNASDIVDDIMLDLRGSSIKDIASDGVGISYRGASVQFRNEKTLRLFFDVTDETAAGSLTASIDGKTLPVHLQDGGMYLEICGLNPEMFDRRELAIKINDKTYKYVPLDYLAQCTASGNELADLSSAMYAFGLFADLYIGNGKDEIPDNGIPVMYLHIKESEGTIDDMIRSSDHSAYCYGTLSIDVPEGFHYCDFPDNVCESVSGLAMSVRGRGNSTWNKSSKKPFKIKLDKKADLFGLGSNKHWVLVANALDSTLIKDRITAWLGDRMGFDFTPRGVPVDLVLMGEEYGTQYLGSYYLSENVRVDSNRLDIDELDEDDTDPQTITGGYLVQNGTQLRIGSPDQFYTDRGENWATHTPSFDTAEDGNFAANGNLLGADYVYDDTFGDPELGDAYENPAQQQYIKNHIQHVEDVLYQGGTAYRELMDVESAAKYYMVQAFSLNNDAYATGSTYIYKERDQGDTVGKIYWGPLWDFDYAWTYNRIVRGFPVDDAWIKPLLCDRSEGGFVPAVQEQWEIMKPALNELIADGGVIDQYCEETRASAECNRAMYPNEDYAESYQAEIDNLKQWIRDRIEWVDANIGNLGEYIHRVEYVVEGQVYRADYYSTSDRITPDEAHPSIDGYTFVGWKDEDGNMITDLVYVTRDMRLEAVYIPDSEVTHGEDIILERDSATVNYIPMISRYQIEYTVIPEDAIDRSVEWSSSDESYATVDENGLVIYHGTGEVTLTARLKNGVTKNFVLTVTNMSGSAEDGSEE